MVKSRLQRFEERKEKNRIVFALAGIIGIFIFFIVFGVRILVAFSLFIDKLRGTTPKTVEQNQVLLIPPQLDPLWEATNSAEIFVTGKVRDEKTIILYINDEESLKTKSKSDGTFRFTGVALKEGTNTISAKEKDDKDNISDLSEVLTIIYKKDKPKLEITAPSDNAQISGEKAVVTISGKTDPDNSVMINDRLVVVRNDGSFSYDLPLKDGEQTLAILSRDPAGNETKIEKKVTYKK